MWDLRALLNVISLLQSLHNDQVAAGNGHGYAAGKHEFSKAVPENGIGVPLTGHLLESGAGLHGNVGAICGRNMPLLPTTIRHADVPHYVNEAHDTKAVENGIRGNGQMLHSDEMGYVVCA